MFDRVAGSGVATAKPLVSVAASLVVHGSLVAIGAAVGWAGAHPLGDSLEGIAVVFRAPPPPPPPPPASAKARKARPRPQPRLVAPPAVLAPREIPQVVPEPEPASPTDDGDEEGVEGGVEGGVIGGVVGGELPPAPAEPPPPRRLLFNPTMTPPERLSGPEPQYTREARLAQVQGLMIVKCVVTVEGLVRECRVLKGLPFMDAAVVEALEQRRYRPALLQGQPVEVDYLFQVRLRTE